MFNLTNNGTRSITYLCNAVAGTYRAVGDDVNGNLINNEVHRYEYDAFNRLMQASNPSSTAPATFIYDALGRRINDA
jgi:hypothetical protein